MNTPTPTFLASVAARPRIGTRPRALAARLAGAARVRGRDWALGERRRLVEMNRPLPAEWPYDQHRALARVIDMTDDDQALELIARAVHEAAVLTWQEIA